MTTVVGTNGLALARYLYEPFGNIIAMSGPWAERNLHRFSSKEWHDPSSLVYYGYRYYSPSLQRWANRDPIGERGGRNLYAFALNRPVAKYDSDGRIVGPVVAACAVAAGGVYLGVCINREACRRARDLVIGLAEAQANANAPDGSTHRGQGATAGNDADLLTHCIASCELATNPGPCGCPDRALAFMQERETGNDPATQIDRLNNEVGAGVALSLDSGQTCVQGCLDALNKGLLYTIANGHPAPAATRR